MTDQLTFDDIRAITFPTDTVVTSTGFISADKTDNAARWPATGDGTINMNISGRTVGDIIAYAMRGMKITWAANQRKRIPALKREHKTVTTFSVPTPGTRGAPTPIVVTDAHVDARMDAMDDDELDIYLAKRIAARADIKKRNTKITSDGDGGFDGDPYTDENPA